MLENLSMLLTHEIIRTIVGQKKQESTLEVPQNQRINEAVKLINANYEKDISLEEIAQSANLSKSHFTKLFTQIMKITPVQYLLHVRLQNAKKMLLSGKLSVTKVSAQCGFNSPSYFAKSFKAAFNETPKEFMQRIK